MCKMYLKSPLAAALNLRWLVNAPFYSVTVNLHKNMDDSRNTPSPLTGESCIELYDTEEGVFYEQCDVITSTDVTFSFVLTSVEGLSTPSFSHISTAVHPPGAAGHSVPLTRGHYSSSILQSLQALFTKNNISTTERGVEDDVAALAFDALLSQIHLPPLLSHANTTVAEAAVDAGEKEVSLVTAKKTSSPLQNCGGIWSSAFATGYSLSYYLPQGHEDRNSSGRGSSRREVENEEERSLEISRRVIDSKYVPCLPFCEYADI